MRRDEANGKPTVLSTGFRKVSRNTTDRAFLEYARFINIYATEGVIHFHRMYKLKNSIPASKQRNQKFSEMRKFSDSGDWKRNLLSTKMNAAAF